MLPKRKVMKRRTFTQARTLRRRLPIAAYLVGVTLVPLLATLVPVVSNVRSANDRVMTASGLTRKISNATAWADLRAAVQGEQLYVEGAATARAFGVPTDVVLDMVGFDLETGIGEWRVTTDRAIAALGSDVPPAAFKLLEVARADTNDPDEVRSAYRRLDALVRDESAARRSALQSWRVTLDGLGSLQQSVDVLWDIERYRTLAQAQMGTFFESIVDPDVSSRAARRLELARSSANIDLLLEQLAARSSTWAERADDVETSVEAFPFVAAVDAAVVRVDSAETGIVALAGDLEALGAALRSASARNEGISAMFAESRAAVEANAAVLIDAAHSERTRSMWAAAGLMAVSFGVAFAVSMLIRRPLRRLEHVARRVSAGELADERRVTSGPREIAVVGAALHEVVVSLRLVSERATALASGQLHASGSREPLPGLLGDTIDATVDKLAESMQEQAALRAQLAYDATHDALTRLPNRAGVLQQLDSALGRAAESGSPIAVLFVDLDGFKQVNDQHGHGAGDVVLQHIGQRLSSLCRPGDIVGRLGGDEFIVVLTSESDADSAERAAQRVAVELNKTIEVDGRQLQVGASVGVAMADGRSPATIVLSEADFAVYRAKRLGKGRVERYDETTRNEHSASLARELDSFSSTGAS
jgi:diguanylate cyclase (GGDEF)-like protein